jgi:hypothetical protein
MKKVLSPGPARVPQTQRCLTAVAALVLFGWGLTTSTVAQTTTPIAKGASEVQGVTLAVAGARKTEITLRQLGTLFPIKLQGIQGMASVPFSVLNGDVVISARLRLNYAYSPALLPRLSHIKVLVNEQLADTIPVSPEEGGKNLQRNIEIPARMITEFNRVQLELIGHYTLDCEDPAHTSLWATISNDSVLELTTISVIKDNDLAYLPQPFFDRRDVRPLVLPTVFAQTPDAATLEAAATLSSWFGSLADYRTARFPVSVNRLPERGNGLLLLAGNAAAPAGLSLPAYTESNVSVVTNPNDPHGKLLVLRGRDGTELKKVAAALAFGNAILTGASADIVEFTPLKPRQPYDAPNWLPSNRPVQFGELAEKSSLNVSGYTPDLIRIGMRLPPDLFSWRDNGVPVNLKYRYSVPAAQNRSSLNISVNEQFLRAYPLRPLVDEGANVLSRTVDKALPAGELALSEEKFHVPLFKMPAQTQLQFHYFHDLVKQGPCKDVVLNNARGTVEPDSTVDISNFPHFLAMPDLAVFANNGFPFTRMADLSETAVVMPNQPDASDYGVLLDLAGVMGRITGYPAAALTVARADQVDALENKDILVLGSSQRQPLQQRWADSLPVRFDDQNKRFTFSDLMYRAFSWWGEAPANDAQVRGTEVVFRNSGQGAVIAGIESPLQSGRSVVMIASDQPGGLVQVVDALLDPERLAAIQGSVTVVRGDQVTSLLAEKSYHVGKLPPLLYMQWFLSRHPLLLMALGIASAALLGLVMYLALRSRARARLGKSQS